ncbi:hypothetical protein CCP2SC5_1620003 [Azospirillaceae bacterium]
MGLDDVAFRVSPNRSSHPDRLRNRGRGWSMKYLRHCRKYVKFLRACPERISILLAHPIVFPPRTRRKRRYFLRTSSEITKPKADGERRAMANIGDIIAAAIKKADTSMFNENYAKQAAAVLQALNKAGYEIVPRRPSEAMMKYIQENMPFGRMRPSELSAQLYVLIVENARRLDEK